MYIISSSHRQQLGTPAWQPDELRYPDRSRRRSDIRVSHPVPQDIHRRRARITAPESLVFEYVHILLTGKKGNADGHSRERHRGGWVQWLLRSTITAVGKLDCRGSVW